MNGWIFQNASISVCIAFVLGKCLVLVTVFLVIFQHNSMAARSGEVPVDRHFSHDEKIRRLSPLTESSGFSSRQDTFDFLKILLAIKQFQKVYVIPALLGSK